MKPMKRSLAPTLTVLVMLSLWELYVRLAHVPHYILPAPSAVAQAVWQYREQLFITHLPVTVAETLLGFVLSVVLGAALGAGMHLWRPVEQALYPLVVASQTIPVIAISPVFLWWFGYTLSQKVAVVVLFGFFPVAVGAIDGLRSADPDLRDLLRSMGATRGRILRMVEIPAALPHFLAGVKVAAAVSVVGATIGEWLGGESGLGIFGRRMTSSLKTPALFASVVLLSLLGIALFLAVRWAEARLLRWRPTGQGNR
jgi:putative hydroxymethylpyrimidine transport system permease protein